MIKFLFLLLPFLPLEKKPIDYYIDKSQSTIYYLYDTKIDSYDLKSNFQFKKSTEIKNSSDFDLTKFKFFNQSKLSSNYGGNILTIKKDSVVRIDNSYEHKMQMNSVEFNRNDTVFRYGGYGFFENRNFFTYYDSEINEWESLDIEGNIIPERISDFVYFIDNNKLFLTGGFKFDQFKKDVKIKNYTSYVFDFVTKKWSITGDMKIHLLRTNSFIIKDGVMVFQDGLIYKLDFYLNSIITYSSNSVSKKLESSVLKPFYYNDQILFFKIENDKVQMNTIPFGRFISSLEIKNSEKIHDNYFSYGFIIIIIFSIVFLILILNKFVIQTYYKKLRKRNEKYYFNFSEITLLEQEKMVLNLLFESSKNIGKVENRDVTNVFDDPSLNYGTINRRKNETIQQLNNKLKVVFKTSENIILKDNSLIDKREVNYSLNSKYL